MADLDADDALEMLDLLDQQADYFVAKARLISWDTGWQDLEGEEACAECEKALDVGDQIFIWGEPLGDTPEKVKSAKHSLLHYFCSEEDLDTYVDRWAQDVGFEEHALALFR